MRQLVWPEVGVGTITCIIVTRYLSGQEVAASSRLSDGYCARGQFVVMLHAVWLVDSVHTRGHTD